MLVVISALGKNKAEIEGIQVNVIPILNVVVRQNFTKKMF